MCSAPLQVAEAKSCLTLISAHSGDSFGVDLVLKGKLWEILDGLLFALLWASWGHCECMIMVSLLFDGLCMEGWKHDLCDNNVSHFIVVTVISKDGELSDRIDVIRHDGCCCRAKVWFVNLFQLIEWMDWMGHSGGYWGSVFPGRSYAHIRQIEWKERRTKSHVWWERYKPHIYRHVWNGERGIVHSKDVLKCVKQNAQNEKKGIMHSKNVSECAKQSV